MLNPIQAVSQAFRRTLDFHGRSRRSAYWWFALFTSIGGLAIAEIDTLLDTPLIFGLPLLFTIFCLVVIVPDLALGMRRLHDTGRRAWLYVVWIIVSYGQILLPVPDEADLYLPNGELTTPGDIYTNMLISLIPSIVMLGLLVVMIFLLRRDSQAGENQYGPNPKGIGNMDVFS